MNIEEGHKLLKLHRDIEKALSDTITIRINHNQIITIVVSDLIRKYKHNIECKNKEWASAFHKILQYYLSEDEINCLTTRSTGACARGRED